MLDFSKIARKTREILDRDGWNQGATTQSGFDTGYGEFPEGSHCIGGAGNIAMHGHDNWWYGSGGEELKFWEAVKTQMKRIDPEHVGTYSDSVIAYVAQWNNNHSKQEVYRVLRAVENA